MRFLHFLCVLLLLSFAGCEGRNSTPVPEPAVAAEADEFEQEYLAAKANASRIAALFDDSQLAAQVIITGIDGRGGLSQAMISLLEECPAGGIMLFKYNLDADNGDVRNLIAGAADLISAGTAVSAAPLVAVDHEGGGVNRFRPGVASLPSAASYWEMAQDKGRETAIAQIYIDSMSAGKIINDLGINFNFAPVAEYLHADNREFLEDRSYGPDPAFAAKASAAFVMGMAQAGIICAVKHFPGSSGPDPHIFPSSLQVSREKLNELTAPFFALVRDGHARAVMIAHTAVSAWDSENIASLSPEVMGGWLRQEIGFNGIIVCDDFSMAASELRGNSRPETAAVQAIAAGADMVLVWPPDLRRTHRELQAALGDGRLSRERLLDSVERIIIEKLRLGLVEDRSF